MPATKDKFEVASHPYEPGGEVEVHEALATEVERNEGRRPGGKPLSTAKVGKDAELEISAKPGTYALVNKADKDDEDAPPRWLVITVK